MKSLYMFTASCVAMASIAAAPTPAKAGTDAYLAEMTLMASNFCPRGTAIAQGQLLAISQNTALFSLVGTTYGGDGRTTFGLPDLRGRAPIGIGQGPGLPNYNWGNRGGSTDFTLTSAQIPSHSHTGTIKASRLVGDTANPSGNAPAIDASGDKIYHTAAAGQNMQSGILEIDVSGGGGMPVNKRSPYLAMYWCIATQGIYPSRS